MSTKQETLFVKKSIHVHHHSPYLLSFSLQLHHREKEVRGQRGVKERRENNSWIIFSKVCGFHIFVLLLFCSSFFKLSLQFSQKYATLDVVSAPSELLQFRQWKHWSGSFSTYSSLSYVFKATASWIHISLWLQC